eukprot:PhF_6_TR32201/c0_g1_i1/m.47859
MTDRTPPSLTTVARQVFKSQDQDHRTLSNAQVRMTRAMEVLDKFNLPPEDVLKAVKETIRHLDLGMSAVMASFEGEDDLDEWCGVLTIWLIDGEEEEEGRALLQTREKELAWRLKASGGQVGRSSAVRHSRGESTRPSTTPSEDLEEEEEEEDTVPNLLQPANPITPDQTPAKPVKTSLPLDITLTKVLLEPEAWPAAIAGNQQNAGRMKEALLEKYGHGKDPATTHQLKVMIDQLHGVFMALVGDPELFNRSPFLVQAQRKITNQLFLLSETLQEDELPKYLQEKTAETREKLKARQLRTDYKVQNSAPGEQSNNARRNRKPKGKGPPQEKEKSNC